MHLQTVERNQCQQEYILGAAAPVTPRTANHRKNELRFRRDHVVSARLHPWRTLVPVATRMNMPLLCVSCPVIRASTTCSWSKSASVHEKNITFPIFQSMSLKTHHVRVNVHAHTFRERVMILILCTSLRLKEMQAITSCVIHLHLAASSVCTLTSVAMCVCVCTHTSVCVSVHTQVLVCVSSP